MFFSSAYSVTCAEIGNCSANTPTVDLGFAHITQLLVGLVGMLAVVFIIISALQMILSAGSPKRFQQARESLLYSVVGVVLAIVAYAIVTFVSGAF